MTTLYDAIMAALDQCKYMYFEGGQLGVDEYIKLVMPLHEALRNASTDQRCGDTEEGQDTIA